MRHTVRTMRKASLILCAAALHAATIRGNVVEHQSGKPLSRVTIRLQPLAGVAAQGATTRTNSFGSFEITGLAAGAYLVTASRQNFVTVQYGQKQWNSAGEPVVLDESSATFLNIRMPHFAAISGRVVDENDVGIPHEKVAAYRNTRPVQLVANATADERGEFRIYGLEPGSYMVRSGPLANEEISYVPTFAKDSLRAEDGRVADVSYDADTSGIEIRPVPGKLLKVAGFVSVSLPVPVNLTFATDWGRDTAIVQPGGPFSFSPVPPGTYEFYAEGPGDGSYRCEAVGLWQEVTLKTEREIMLNAPCMSFVTIGISGLGGQRVDASKFSILARRVDMAGPGEVRQVAMEGRRSLLLPGRWEVELRTPPNYYVAGFSSNRPNQVVQLPDGWNPLTVTTSGYAQFRVSNSPGAIHGVVTGTSHEPVAGAPVYLEEIDPATGTRGAELRVATTDTRGQYRFQGLAPGNYNILATFEYKMPDADTMAMARPQSVSVKEAGDVQQDLDLFVLR